jgi:hypothetical protein
MATITEALQAHQFGKYFAVQAQSVNEMAAVALTTNLPSIVVINMKRLLLPALIALVTLLPISSFAQQEELPAPPPVGDPNYYGQVDPVNNAAPPVIYSTPIVVQQAPDAAYYPPVYLRVPPQYYQNWPQYCGFYNACFYPVFFVQEGWYINWYGPWYRRYYPYGRPGFSARFYYGPHPNGGYYQHRDGSHGQYHEGSRGQFHEEHHR